MCAYGRQPFGFDRRFKKIITTLQGAFFGAIGTHFVLFAT